MNNQIQDTESDRSFRNCAVCGQPTPALMPQCINCGAISAQAVVADQQMKAERRFIEAILSRSSPATKAILSFNVVIYLVMSYVSGESRDGFFSSFISGADSMTLLAFGAKINDLLARGEWFRLITPIFIHIGLLHIASNSYALWMIGPLVEKLYGSARYMLIYLLSGIGGVFASYLWQVMNNKPLSVSAGASGAIFGLFGVLAVFGYKYREELPHNFRRAIISSVLPVILINLFIGVSIQFIDNAAHVGGLVSGAVLTLLIPYLPPGSKRISKLGIIILVACVSMVGYSFLRAYQQSDKYLEMRNHDGYK